VHRDTRLAHYSRLLQTYSTWPSGTRAPPAKCPYGAAHHHLQSSPQLPPLLTTYCLHTAASIALPTCYCYSLCHDHPHQNYNYDYNFNYNFNYNLNLNFNYYFYNRRPTASSTSTIYLTTIIAIAWHSLNHLPSTIRPFDHLTFKKHGLITATWISPLPNHYAQICPSRPIHPPTTLLTLATPHWPSANVFLVISLHDDGHECENTRAL